MNRSVESVVLSYHIRYERLTELINYAFAGSDANTINLYIDLYPILRDLYTDRFVISYDKNIDLVPLILNMCAHYRYFFSRYYNVYTNIYLVAGRNIPQISSMLIPKYNYTMEKRNNGPSHSIIDDMVSMNFDIMNILVPYLQDIHFINTEFETSVVMGYIMSIQENKDIPNIIISKDIYPIQLVTSNRFNNTTFIMPYKTIKDEMHVDVSAIVGSASNPNNWKDFWEFYIHHRRLKFTSNIFINPANISPIIALSGLPERSINALMRFDGSYGMISQIMGTTASQCSIETLYNSFDLDGKIPKNIVEDRFHVIDVVYQMDALYTNSSEALLMKFENKHDPETVKKICDKYFTNIPINLEKL